MRREEWPQMNTDKHRSADRDDPEEYLHADLTGRIIGVFYDVYNELGHGFLESVYQSAMGIALEEAGLTVNRLVKVPVWFRGREVGEFIADLMVENTVLLELKAAGSRRRPRVATVELPAGDSDRGRSPPELRPEAAGQAVALR